jgi:hypothetical protein
MSNKIINKLKEVPFSGNDIREALDGNVKIIRYEEIHKFKTLDELLTPYNSVCILYQTKPNYGHWCCLFKHRYNPDISEVDTVEFNDPYGYKIDEQLEFINADFRKKSNQDYPYLARLMLESPYKLTYNNKKLQKRADDVSSCGRHCSLRLILKDTPLKQYQDFLMSGIGISKLNADDKATYLTAFI